MSVVKYRVLNSNNFIVGVDYLSGPYNITILAGTTKLAFNITIMDDNILESDEQFQLNIASHFLPNNVTLGDPSQTNVTILDNDCKS